MDKYSVQFIANGEIQIDLKLTANQIAVTTLLLREFGDKNE